MPNFDGKGPQCCGPRTGRGIGCCSPGFGRRFSFRRPSKEEELKWLKEDEKALEEELAVIKEEIKQLAKD